MLESGTVLGEVECPGCGAKVPLKINVSGGVYYYCGRVLYKHPNGKNEQCCTRFNYGREASKRVIKEFMESNHVEKPENEESTGTGAHIGTDAGRASAEETERGTDTSSPEPSRETDTIEPAAGAIATANKRGGLGGFFSWSE